jgi:hypothetical protein
MTNEDQFRIAGSVTTETEEAVLGNVLKVVGYTSNIHKLVKKSFGFCDFHGVATPRPIKAKALRAAAAGPCSCPTGLKR